LSNTETVTNLRGPILVLGAGGFIGSALFWKLRETRTDVYGTSRTPDMPRCFIFTPDLAEGARAIVEYVKPATIFDCVTYGGYLAETDVSRIYRTNVDLKAQLLELASEYKITYVHAGSSSEYGHILDAPLEDSALQPNSHYAVAKGASAGLISYFGKHRGLKCANLRLYAVYGPGEREENRLIPQLVKAARRGEYPPLGDPRISRDFIHVDDVCDALISAAISLEYSDPAIVGLVPGDSVNIGTGWPTTIRELAYRVKNIFDIKKDPEFLTSRDRSYDFPGRWCANPNKALRCMGWRYRVSLRAGLERLKNAN
jgi:polyisoprenyl-phosphate glycosyltransferase